MKRFLINRAKVLVPLAPMACLLGCNSEIKTLLIDQAIGFASALAAAAATNLLQGVFPAT